MEHIWESYEELEEYVHVVDVQTLEIVYMNKRLRKDALGDENADFHGRHCYDVSYDFTERCPFCNMEQLLVQKSDEWERFHSKLNKHLRIIDTLIIEGERKYKLQLGIDMGAGIQDKDDIRLIHYYEKVTNEAMRIGVEQPEPKLGLQRILAYLGEVLKGERVYIFEQQPDGTINNTFEWCADGVEPQINELQNLPPDTGQQWYESFRKDGIVAIEDVEKTKETDPGVYEILKPQGIRSLIAVLLYHGDTLIGFYGIDDSSLNNVKMVRDLLEMLASFTVALLRKRDLVERIRVQGLTDSMTKVGNRHALYDFMETLPQRENIGVIFCDVTRLKYVNDHFGHMAGDRMICEVADALLTEFPKEYVFRAGGDEFIVLCPNITEEQLKMRLQQVQTEWERKSIVVAAGTNWTHRLVGTAEEFSDVAERRMYEMKAKWYVSTGNDRRR